MVCRLEKDSVSVIRVIKGLDSYGITSIHKAGDGSRFIIGTDDYGLFQLKISDKGDDLTRLPNHPEFNSLKVQSITEGTEGSLWISTSGSGVIQFDLTANSEQVKSLKFYDINSGLPVMMLKLYFKILKGIIGLDYTVRGSLCWHPIH